MGRFHDIHTHNHTHFCVCETPLFSSAPKYYGHQTSTFTADLKQPPGSSPTLIGPEKYIDLPFPILGLYVNCTSAPHSHCENKIVSVIADISQVQVFLVS